MRIILSTLMLMLVSLTALADDQNITLNVTKTNWDVIGSEQGEVVATVNSNLDPFDHYEAEIRCSEDPEQYISFANLNSIEGELMCFCYEGGHFDLYKDYHYTLTVKAFDVPYYGVQPKVTATYDFLGTGIEAPKYADVTATIDLEQNIMGLGYNLPADGMIEVHFSAPVTGVKAWVALGFEGSRTLYAYSMPEGLTWIVDASEFIGSQGSFDLHVTGFDIATGYPIKGLDGDHSFAFTIVNITGLPTPVLEENGTSVNEIKTLTFTYDAGISLNYNAGSAWKQIAIADAEGNTVATNFSEKQFSVQGTDGKTITLTLSEAITNAGTYTVKVPYAAFFLDSDLNAVLSGAAEYTISVENSTGISDISNEVTSFDYNISGQRVNGKKGLIIQNGKKMFKK